MLKIQNKRIIITAGGTGGHIFPAKALAIALHKNHAEVFVIMDNRANNYQNKWNPQIQLINIIVAGVFGKSFLTVLKNLFLLVIGFLQSIFYFLKIKPQAVISFGGYIAVPVLLSAVILRVPIILHEQNAYIGRANKVFLKFAKVITTAFQNTYGIKKKYQTKIHYTGLPIREEFLDFRAKPKIQKDYYQILILGGSQGAAVFSEIIPKSFAMLTTDEQKKFKVYHQCRVEFLTDVSREWQKTSVSYDIKSFFINSAELMWQSDVIIARSGSATIHEISAIGRYSLLIPFVYAIDNHQTYNAKEISAMGGAELILQKDLNSSRIASCLKDILNTKLNLKEKEALVAKSYKENSVNEIINIIERII